MFYNQKNSRTTFAEQNEEIERSSLQTYTQVLQFFVHFAAVESYT